MKKVKSMIMKCQAWLQSTLNHQSQMKYSWTFQEIVVDQKTIRELSTDRHLVEDGSVGAEERELLTGNDPTNMENLMVSDVIEEKRYHLKFSLKVLKCPV